MRLEFIVIYTILILALGTCAIIAKRSRRTMGPSVALLMASLLPPVIGNVIIIASGTQQIATVGCYIYFLGMDFVMFALMGFTMQYCNLQRKGSKLRYVACVLLAVDVLQILLNPLFGHTFSTEPILVEGYYYFRLIPYAGQMFHRAAVYFVFLGVIVIFARKALRSPKIYAERYWVILFTMVFTGVWETFYIFSRTPIDRSMIGFGVFGILVFYFALYYRPLRLLDQMLAGVASEMPEALFFYDYSGRCIWVNQKGMELTGIKSEEEYDQATERLENMFGEIGKNQAEWSLQYVSGSGSFAEYYVLEKHTTPDIRGGSAGSFLSIRNNTEDQQELRRERYQATHDRLTGMYTKEYLFDKIRAAFEVNPDREYLVIFVNVSEFKIVNDIFGNTFGDYALQRIGDWIRENMTEDSIYGRLAGDTFGICMPAADFHPERMEEDLSNFIVSDGTVEHLVLIHMGVYEVTEKELDVSLMFDRARIALSTVKDTYQTHIAYYDDEMREQVMWNQQISTQLTDAIEQKQVQPWLQPMVDENGNIVGAEVLARWIHPEHGFLPPVKFVPVFERNGIIADLDRYMWKCACEILSRWEQEGKDLFLSINISPRDFYFMDVAQELKDVVANYHIDPAKLRIEITETVMMADVDKRVKILDGLKADGFYVEMDDFGSGYSSLNLLKDMPVDLIKVDMIFLKKSANEQKAQTILRNIFSLTDDLGITALTEGVETQAQYEMLSELGCRLFQGYYFAKPMPAEEFEEFYRESCEKD